MNFSHSVLLLIVVVAMLSGSGAYVGFKIRAATRSENDFAYFISHHKGSGGNTARLLKLLLGLSTDGTIFFDADNLDSLANIFDAVKGTRNFVFIFSGEILCRRWCIGELVTAHQTNLPVIPVHFISVEGPVDRYVEIQGTELELILTSFESLSSYGISVEDCQESIKKILAQTKILARDCFEAAGQITQAAKVPGAKISFHQGPSFFADLIKNKEDTKTGAMLLGDGTDLEAVSVAYFLKLTLQKEIQRPIFVDVGENVLKSSLQVMANCPTIGVILTGKAFQSPSLAPRMVYMYRMPERVIHPLLTCKEFAYPTGDFIENMAKTGQPIARTKMELMDMIKPLTTELTNAGVAEPSAKEMSEAYKALFTTISVPFEINFSSQAAIDQQRDAVISRFKLRSLKMTGAEDAKLGVDALIPMIKACKYAEDKDADEETFARRPSQIAKRNAEETEDKVAADTRKLKQYLSEEKERKESTKRALLQANEKLDAMTTSFGPMNSTGSNKGRAAAEEQDAKNATYL